MRDELLSPMEIEDRLGKGYFYRMRVFRWEKDGWLLPLERGGRKYYLAKEIINAADKSLRDKLERLLSPNFHVGRIVFNYDDGKELNVQVFDTKNSFDFEADTDSEGEVELVGKILREVGVLKTYWS